VLTTVYVVLHICTQDQIYTTMMAILKAILYSSPKIHHCHCLFYFMHIAPNQPE